MWPRTIRFLRSFRHPQGINLNPVGLQHPCLSDLTTELKGARKFSLTSLMALIAILAISGSKALQLVALTLLIYTISLHLAINTSFVHDYPTLSRFLHVIPPLGTSGMASVALVSDLKSPALAVVALSLGLLPLVTIAIYQGILCAEMSAAELPMQMQHVPASAASGSADTSRVDRAGRL